MIINEKAVIALTPSVDHSEKEGYFVVESSDTAVLVSATTDVAIGVITNGVTTYGQDDIALCGAFSGIVEVKLGGAATKFNFGTLMNDGTVQNDPGSGNRVQVCRFLQTGVAGDRVHAILIRPTALS